MTNVHLTLTDILDLHDAAEEAESEALQHAEGTPQATLHDLLAQQARDKFDQAVVAHYEATGEWAPESLGDELSPAVTAMRRNLHHLWDAAGDDGDIDKLSGADLMNEILARREHDRYLETVERRRSRERY